MRKRKIEAWKTRIKNILRGLRFSTLDADTRACADNEIFYFNNSRLPVLSWAVIAMETFNMINVIFFSESGLGTANNRQYFAMYLLMLASGIACLAFRRLLRGREEVLQRCYVGFTLFWALWNGVLSAMDLRHNPSIIVYAVGILGLALLVRLKPMETLVTLSGGLLALLLTARAMGAQDMTVGIAVNAAIVALVAALVSCSQYFSMLEGLGYRQKLVLQANHLTEEKRKLAVLQERQEALLHHSGELLFIWDRKSNSFTMANQHTLCDADRQTLCGYLTGQGTGDAQVLTLHLSDKGALCSCRIEFTPFFDGGELLTGAAGRIIPVL